MLKDSEISLLSKAFEKEPEVGKKTYMSYDAATWEGDG